MAINVLFLFMKVPATRGRKSAEKSDVLKPWMDICFKTLNATDSSYWLSVFKAQNSNQI